ncbi:C2H2-type domain-containing protein, partial [Haematococcus lacustris]
KRTLGRVHEYFTAAGQRLVPPVGHQVSLKYCLSQEGWEARIVQNSAASPSVAMASGMGRLLDRIRRGELASPGANSRLLVILCSDDEEGLQQPLLRMRGLGGAATLVVCSERHRLRQPD